MNTFLVVIIFCLALSCPVLSCFDCLVFFFLCLGVVLDFVLDFVVVVVVGVCRTGLSAYNGGQ